MKSQKKGKEILYLSIKNVKDANLSMKDAIDILEGAFIEKENGRVEIPQKVGIHTKKDSFMQAMPGWIPNYESCGVKWISGYPENNNLGYPYITGLIILNCPNTGIPLSIMDCRWITAMRTGAISGLGAKYFANPDSELLGIIGCGAQARTSLEAILLTCPKIKKVLVFDIVHENAKYFVDEMGTKFNLNISKVSNQKEAVEDADIIVTAGLLVENRIIEAVWFKEGAFACPVDIDVMWKPEAFQIVDKYYVDDYNQHTYFKDLGYCKNTPEIYGDLGGVITKKIKGRETGKERIMFISIGISLGDIAVASRVYQRAINNDIGSLLPL